MAGQLLIPLFQADMMDMKEDMMNDVMDDVMGADEDEEERLENYNKSITCTTATNLRRRLT